MLLCVDYLLRVVPVLSVQVVFLCRLIQVARDVWRVQLSRLAPYNTAAAAVVGASPAVTATPIALYLRAFPLQLQVCSQISAQVF